jgi:hypothetical protein
MVNKTRADYEEDWRKEVRAGIERANKQIEEVRDLVTNLRISELSDLKTRIKLLEFKAGALGTVGGAIMGAVINWILHK